MILANKFSLPLKAMQGQEQYKLRMKTFATFKDDIPPVLQQSKKSENRPIVHHNQHKSAKIHKFNSKRSSACSKTYTEKFLQSPFSFQAELPKELLDKNVSKHEIPIEDLTADSNLEI